jgi:hypothetical protein
MAGKQTGSDFKAKLEALKREIRLILKNLGIDPNASVEFEPIGRTRVVRVIVVSKGFALLRHEERQKYVWEAAERVLQTPEDRLRISMILTVAPTELAA